MLAMEENLVALLCVGGLKVYLSMCVCMCVCWDVQIIVCLSTHNPMTKHKCDLKPSTSCHPIHHHRIPPQRPRPSFPSPNALARSGPRCLPGSLHSGIHFTSAPRSRENETPLRARRRVIEERTPPGRRLAILHSPNWQAAVHWERGVFCV
ncbi:hypothetical protein EDB81DRAFT_152431 [Dactylonectria macrodidyma]|uniref:Uncharacterized protein n=1 Tax=Dactylonectria macrodidyma TaxID=307937 RepID=A0A9P9FMK9_9HYPO|nr:hypothetical protein EDB81DRAFT_152431 [Dactylonectria macrodidyma]